MKISKMALVIAIVLIASLFATNVFAVTPTIIKPTPTKTPFFTPTPTRTPLITPTRTPIPTKLYYRMNVHAFNNTGRDANDLEIFIKGNVQVLDWWRDPMACPFQSMTFWYDPVTDTTIVRFYNGIVRNGMPMNCCIFLDQNIMEYQVRRWSYDGVPGPPLGPTVSFTFDQNTGGGMGLAMSGPIAETANITITNAAEDGGPVTISVLEIGAANRGFSFAELLYDNPVLNQEVAWSVKLFNIHLDKGGKFIIPQIAMPAPAIGLVYKAKIWLDSDPSNINEYVSQFTPQAVIPQ